MSYYQLNTITAYDFKDSSILPEEYCQRAKELGYQGVAVKDHSFFCYPSFADSARTYGLKPLFGCRVNLATAFKLPLDGVLYIKNEQGYRNLCEILSRKLEVLGSDILSLYHEGLILVLDTERDDYRDLAYLNAIASQLFSYSHIFQDDFYVGIIISNEVDINEMPALYDFCSNCSYKTVAFPKSLYIRKSDAYKTALLYKALKKEKVDILPETGPFFLLSEKALSTLYRQEDMDRTIELADKCHFDFFAKRGKPVSFPDDNSKLEKMAVEGLMNKIGKDLPQNYINRLSYELDTIRKMNFSSYFLLVSDYVRFAKSSGIKIGPGRGSAAGSLVTYALDITALDPIKCDFSFERFLNPKRSNMPDIDIDFEDDRRNEVISYIRKRYGETHVSDIITFVRLRPRSALNLIGNALSFSPVRLKKLTSSIPETADNFKDALNDSFKGPKLDALLQDPYYKDLVMKADSLLGIPVNTSNHPAGIIINEDEIYKSCPLSQGKTGIALYEFPNMERMGFLKCDILSLSNLTFIKNIEKQIKDNSKTLPNIMSDLDNPLCYKILNDGDLAYIFQLEKSGMRKAIKTLKPSSFKDLAALLALYRPGPMAYINTYAKRKDGLEKVTYLDPRLDKILKDTYGIMIYQEQVIEAVKEIASFTASDADLFRRAISKKNLQKMEEYKDKFLKGAIKNGIKSETAESIYKDIEKFANYGFNKSHSYSYALISYTLLYYKALFPEEFYSVSLQNTSLSSLEMSFLQKEIHKRQYVIKVPDINTSKLKDILIKNKEIFLPFSGVSATDKNLLEKIIAEREKSGPFQSFYSFCKRTEEFVSFSEEKSIDSLIKAGVFDSLEKNREEMSSKLDDYMSFAKMGFTDSNVPALKKNGEDIGKRLYLEKTVLGSVISEDLDKIAHKDGYRTLIITDDSDLEMHHYLVATDGRKDYQIEVKGRKEALKNAFILVNGDFSWNRIIPYDFIYLGRKVTK